MRDAVVASCELWVSLAYWLLALLAARGDTPCTPAAALCAAGGDRAQDRQGVQGGPNNQLLVIC